jgi:hypothetical protein
MSMAKALRGVRVGLALAAMLLAGGCYETDVALIASGDKADIAGRYACKMQMGDKEDFDLTITDNGDGNYHFGAPDVTGDLKLKKLDDKRWLLQIGDDEKIGTWYYAYGQATEAKGFQASYPKRDNTDLATEAMHKYGLRFLDALDHDDLTGSTVKGAPEDILRFVSDPAVQELADWFNCKRSD